MEDYVGMPIIGGVDSAQIPGRPQPGDLFADRYLIEELIGEGGMGSVFRATEIETAEVCALKLLRPRLGQAFDLIRFKREFRAASRLEHPNCVRAFELGTCEGSWYFTMEYLAGGSLSRELHGASLGVVCSIAMQVLAALDHIHSANIVHRDVKPRNILLESPVDKTTKAAPRVKLSDFGISKMADLDDESRIGKLWGSIRYLAPEQLADGRADPRSDQFAIGVVLYELLAGQHPHGKPAARSLAAWLDLRTKGTLVPISSVAPELPSDVAVLIDRFLQDDPADRYPTASTAYDALKAWTDQRGFEMTVPEHPPLERSPYLAAPRFLGREREVRAVELFLRNTLTAAEEHDDAQSDEGTPRDAQPDSTIAGPAVLFVSGEAGVGKSQLLARLVTISRSMNVTPSLGTCRAEVGDPFEPVWSLVERSKVMTSTPTLRPPPPAPPSSPDASDPISGTPSDDSVTRSTQLVSGASSESAGAASPHGRRAGDEVAARGEAELWKFYRRVAGRLVNRAQRNPLLFVLEDAQWADGPSLRLLTSVVREIVEARKKGARPKVALVISHRPADHHIELCELHELTKRHNAGVHLPLGPLDEHAAAGLVASMLSTDVSHEVRQFTRTILADAAGNPLFITQILHALLETAQLRWGFGGWDLTTVTVGGAKLPTNIRDAIGDRAARFAVNTKRAIAMAAVLGRRFDLKTLGVATELDELILLDCLDEVIRAHFVEEVEDLDADLVDGSAASFRFVHDRFRESIYSSLSDEQRTKHHEDAALAIEEQHGDDPEHAADLAHHFGACGHHDKHFTYCVRAGDQAMANHGVGRAADFFGEALEVAAEHGLEVSLDLVERHGDACRMSGEFDVAASSYERLLRDIDDGDKRIEVLRKAAELEWRRGNTAKAAAPMEQMLELCGFSVPRSNLSLNVRLALAAMLFVLYTLVPALIRKKRRRGVVTLDAQCEMCAVLIEIYQFMDYRRCGFYTLAAINLAARLGPRSSSTGAFVYAGAMLGMMGLYGTGYRYLDLAKAFGKQSRAGWEKAWQGCARARAPLPGQAWPGPRERAVRAAGGGAIGRTFAAPIGARGPCRRSARHRPHQQGALRHRGHLEGGRGDR